MGWLRGGPRGTWKGHGRGDGHTHSFPPVNVISVNINKTHLIIDKLLKTTFKNLNFRSSKGTWDGEPDEHDIFQRFLEVLHSRLILVVKIY